MDELISGLSIQWLEGQRKDRVTCIGWNMEHSADQAVSEDEVEEQKSSHLVGCCLQQLSNVPTSAVDIPIIHSSLHILFASIYHPRIS